MATTDTVQEVTELLKKITNFDTNSLSRQDELGKAFAFTEVVPYARQIIALFEKIPSAALEEFPAQQLKIIKDNVNLVLNKFIEIIDFDAAKNNAQQTRTNIISQMQPTYQTVFTALFPLISYAMARTVDFNALSDQGRTAVQDIKNQADTLMKGLEEQKKEGAKILDDVRNAAAEQGVSQQAKYFAEESKDHEKLAEKWQGYTIGMAIAVGVYGILSFFLHKIPWIAPTDLPSSIQFIASKLLIFFILSYMLFLCSRNFLSHRHNQIVNKHRQNALMTYTTLVDAGATPEARDLVLNHAAASIYRLHDTGYVRGSGSRESSSSTSIVEMMPKATMPLSAVDG